MPGDGRARAAGRDPGAPARHADPADHRPRRARPGRAGPARGGVRLHPEADRPRLLRRLAAPRDRGRELARRIELQRLELERHALCWSTSGDGVFVVDREGVVQFWNLAAEQITGIGLAPGRREPGGRACSAAGRGSGRKSLLPAGRAPSASARMLPFEVAGRELWLSFCGVDVADATVYSFQDRTDERVVDKLKDDFVATASHELRTPLSAIYGAARRCAGPMCRSTTRARRSTDRRSSRASPSGSARVIDDILFASHLDSGRCSSRPSGSTSGCSSTRSSTR